MSSKLITTLISAVVVVVLAAIGLFTGQFDGLLGKMNLSIAGHPPVVEAAAPPAVTAKAETPVAPAAKEQVVPVFDLVRVEPSGDAVIAGQGVPNSHVDILSGEKVVANGTANDAGAWAIVLAKPLKPGAYDLSVRTTDAAGGIQTSTQSVAVSVPEDGKSDVLVVLNQPGTPSTVLEVPSAEESKAKLAEATPAATAEVAGTSTASAVVPATPVAEAATATDGATATAASAPDAIAKADIANKTTEVAAAATATMAKVAENAGAAVDSAAGAEPGVAAKAASESTAPVRSAMASKPAAPAGAVLPASGAAEATSSASGAVAAPDTTEVASAEVAGTAAAALPAAKAAPAIAADKVTIEAVELENGKTLYAAGAAPAGSVVRLYVDDAMAGDAQSAVKGRWLFTGELALASGSHVVRADGIDASGKVMARAEVSFDIAENLVVTASGTGSVQLGSGFTGVGGGEPTTIIIRKGDNLWTIAKRLYGRGVRYSTIYQANTDQIRNPDLIYPSQVFVLPEGDTAWTAAAGN